MKNRASILEEVAEIRTCASIIGLACGRMVKKKHNNIISVTTPLTYVKMMDECLHKLYEHLESIEALLKNSD